MQTGSSSEMSPQKASSSKIVFMTPKQWRFSNASPDAGAEEAQEPSLTFRLPIVSSWMVKLIRTEDIIHVQRSLKVFVNHNKCVVSFWFSADTREWHLSEVWKHLHLGKELPAGNYHCPKRWLNQKQIICYSRSAAKPRNLLFSIHLCLYRTVQ